MEYEILNTIPLIIWKLNNVFDTIYYNKAWTDFCDSDDIFDKNIMHPDDKLQVDLNWQKAQKSGVFKVNRRLKNKFGVYKWFYTQAIHQIKDGSWIGSCTDINELIELRNNKILTEETRFNLSKHAILLAIDAKKFSVDRDISEKKRLDLEEIAKILADNFVIAEEARVVLEEKAEIAENKRLVLEDNFVIAENKRIVLEDNFVIAENKRLDLKHDAKILSKNFIIAEDKRIDLAEKAKVLAGEAINSEIKIKNLRKRNLWKKSCNII